MDKKPKAPGEGALSRSRTKENNRLSAYYLTISDVDLQEFAPRRIPYDVKDIIKAAVPVSFRVWDADDKCWHIHRDYIPTVDKLVHRHTGRDELTGLTWADSWCVLYLRQGAPESVIHAAADCLIQSTDSEAIRTRIQTARRILLEW